MPQKGTDQAKCIFRRVATRRTQRPRVRRAWLRRRHASSRQPHPNFARNLTRSFFEIGHKRCNSNDTNSTFEQAAGELRATLLGNHSGISNGRTHRYGGRQHQAGPHRPEIVCRDTATGTPQRREAATGFPATASSRSAALSEAPPIRRSCPRGPRPRRGQPRGGRRGRGTASRTRSPGPRHGRSGSTAGRHRARRTRRA